MLVNTRLEMSIDIAGGNICPGQEGIALVNKDFLQQFTSLFAFAVFPVLLFFFPLY